MGRRHVFLSPRIQDWISLAGLHPAHSPYQLYLSPASTIPSELPPPINHSLRLRSAVNFGSLSAINAEIYRLLQVITQSNAYSIFEHFVPNESVAAAASNGYVSPNAGPKRTSGNPSTMQSVMVIAQDHLAQIKRLRQQFYSGKSLIEERGEVLDRSPPGESGDQAATWTPFVSFPSSSSFQSPQDQNSHSAECLDSATAFLVISSFIQLVTVLERTFRLFGALHEDVPVQVQLACVQFADVVIVDQMAQATLFCELFYHLTSQIVCVLGIPNEWSEKYPKIGLLSPPKYRKILNDHLGSVEAGWSVRPARLLELMLDTKQYMMKTAILGL